MKVSRTFDEEFIASCYAVPETWKTICDDENINPELFFPCMDRENYWLEVTEEGDRLGVFLGRRVNHITYEAHTILLPKARGRASLAALAAIKWMFDNTPCLRLVTNVPSFNASAVRLCHAVGMEQYGTNVKSFQKNGQLFDQLEFGISKG
jgi:RimJ/RimL family protein N-acetyltransferase